jgi:hypothetical protein
VSEREPAGRFAVTLRFYGDLPFFLKRSASGGVTVRLLREKTSIKDVIESCGVPHPEVDLILCDSVPRAFQFHVIGDTAVEVYPVTSSMELHRNHQLQRRHLTRFVVDGHLGKLARDLRLLGFDTVYRSDVDDAVLLHIAVEQERALLTRDRRLLMHARIRDGYCPRVRLCGGPNRGGDAPVLICGRGAAIHALPALQWCAGAGEKSRSFTTSSR